MKKTSKRLLSLVMAVILLASVGTASFAANDGTDTAVSEGTVYRYTYIDRISASISVSGITATCKATLNAKVSTTLSIKMELQKEQSTGYETVKTWSDSDTGTYLAMSETRAVNLLETYRLKVTFKAGNETNIIYRYA